MSSSRILTADTMRLQLPRLAKVFKVTVSIVLCGTLLLLIADQLQEDALLFGTPQLHIVRDRQSNTNTVLTSIDTVATPSAVLSRGDGDDADVDGGDAIPKVFVITPTYARLTQKPDLLRMCYTLAQVRNLHWIVVEDSHNTTQLVTDLLTFDCNFNNIRFTQLAIKNTTNNEHRGLAQRNLALQWIRQHVTPGPHAGGIYFGDDDNAYDIRLFEAVRHSVGVSVWLVGFSGGAAVEGPVCANGTVTGFKGVWENYRTFPLDMGAFAVGVNYFLSHPNAGFSDRSLSGFLETDFLTSIQVKIEDMTPPSFDPNCQLVLVWHTKTTNPEVRDPVLYTRSVAAMDGLHTKNTSEIKLTVKNIPTNVT